MAVALALSALLTLALPAAAQAEPVKLADLSFQLIYEHDGSLSPDLTEAEDFVAWNTVIGEGSAAGPANDALVMVTVLAGEEMFVDDSPIDLVAYADPAGEGAKEIARRRWDAYLVSGGELHLPLFLQNIGCAGDLTIEARIGSTKLVRTLSLPCGE